MPNKYTYRDHFPAPASMRPQIMHTMRSAVESGDAVSALNFYCALVGPRAAARMSRGSALAQMDAWLAEQGQRADETLVN